MRQDNETPAILHYAKRVILWGCREEDGFIVAGIGFFNSNLSMEEFNVTAFNSKEKVFRLKLPEDFKKQRKRGRSQNVTLQIVERF